MQRYYYGLDAVRFFAAFAVCVFHLGFYVWASEFSSMGPIFAQRASFDLLTPAAWAGWIGVQIFFVISGFVIANSANGTTPFAFLRSRLLRLWPAAWVCATITVLVRLLAGEDFFRNLDGAYLRSLVLWPKGEWVEGAYWSLAVEIAFYGLIFLLLLTRSFRRLLGFAWVLTLASGVYLSLAASKAWRLAAPGGWFDAIAAQAEFLPLRHGVFFAIGIWMWALANRSLPRSGWFGLAVAAVFGVLEIEMRASDIQVLEAPAALGQPLVMPVLVWLAAVGVMFACTRQPDKFTPRSEVTKARFRLAGKITYPLYLVHGALGALTMRLLIDGGMPPYLALVCATGVIVGVAALVAIYGEPMARRPLRACLDQAGRAGARLKPLGLLFRQADAIPLKQA